MVERIKVFVSWSGERSRLVARALCDVLPDMVQVADCWISEVDIGAGAQWTEALKESLESCGFGVLCLTPENLNSPWMLFEAGYLAKGISGARIVPYLHDLKPTDVPFPLAQFQAAEATLEGTLKLVHSLNDAAPSRLPRDQVERVCRHWWSHLEGRLASVPKSTPGANVGEPTLRDDRALLEELVLQVRQLSQRVDGIPAQATRQGNSNVSSPVKAEAPNLLASSRAKRWFKPLWNYSDDELGALDDLDLRQFIVDANAVLSDDTSHALDQLLGGRVARSYHILAARSAAATASD